MAAPIASQILGEVLPYLEINKDNISEEEIISKVMVPNVEGLTIKEAKKVLEESNLKIQYDEELGEEYIIKQQVPISEVQVWEESAIIVK
ncbi:MAG: PASTA domain-containing protein [Clostridia bacterium]|nr:PASTA domain-containing protein [Clostridia bacterium]